MKLTIAVLIASFLLLSLVDLCAASRKATTTKCPSIETTTKCPPATKPPLCPGKPCGPGGKPCEGCPQQGQLCKELLAHVDAIGRRIRRCVCGQKD